MITHSVDYTYHAPSVWDWVVFVVLEVQCAIVLILSFLWLPISDWLMRRRLRKEQEWKYKHAGKADRPLLRTSQRASAKPAKALYKLNEYPIVHSTIAPIIRSLALQSGEGRQLTPNLVNNGWSVWLTVALRGI